MEELDDLKSIWKGNQPFAAKPMSEIATMLKGSSNSAIAKLKRSVWFELSLTIFFGLIMLYFSFTLDSGRLKWSLVSVIILFIAYLVYYFKKMRLLNRFEPSQQNLKESLEGLISSLETYLQFYRTSYTVLYPVYFLLGIIFTGVELGYDAFLEKVVQPETILKLLSLAIVFGVVSLFISKWYLKKLYGNHLDNLKIILNDLNDSGS